MNDRAKVSPETTTRPNYDCYKPEGDLGFLQNFFNVRVSVLALDPTDLEFPKWMKAQRILRHLIEGFQTRAIGWGAACLGSPAMKDKAARNRRFLEEATELVQAADLSREQALAVVEYVYARPKGQVAQEVGGVMVTLAALCGAHGLSMEQEADSGLSNCWQSMDKIKARQLVKDSDINAFIKLTTNPPNARHARRGEALRDVPQHRLGQPGVPTLMVNQGTVEEPNFIAYTEQDADNAGDPTILLVAQEGLLKDVDKLS